MRQPRGVSHSLVAIESIEHGASRLKTTERNGTGVFDGQFVGFGEAGIAGFASELPASPMSPPAVVGGRGADRAVYCFFVAGASAWPVKAAATASPNVFSMSSMLVAAP